MLLFMSCPITYLRIAFLFRALHAYRTHSLLMFQRVSLLFLFIIGQSTHMPLLCLRTHLEHGQPLNTAPVLLNLHYVNAPFRSFFPSTGLRLSYFRAHHDYRTHSLLI